MSAMIFRPRDLWEVGTRGGGKAIAQCRAERCDRLLEPRVFTDSIPEWLHARFVLEEGAAI
jgi:hypothetical protein